MIGAGLFRSFAPLLAKFASSVGADLVGYDATQVYSAGTLGAIVSDAARNVRMFPWNAKGDGVTDDTAAIQAAVDSLAGAPYGGIVRLPRGRYVITAPLSLARGVRLVGEGKDGTILQISGDHEAINQKMLGGGTVNAQNIHVTDLQILGTDDATKVNQHGIVCSSSLQYSTFERILINKVGANGIHAPVSALGSIYNSFRDIEIIGHRGYAAYIAGNFGQNVLERVRSYGGWSHGFVIDGTNNAGSNPLCNTFIGCACEHTSNTTDDIYGVWFKSNGVYNAYDTQFLDCYWEPDAKAVGDSAAFVIGAAKGVQIIGGHIAFCHWGVKLTSQYSEGVYVQGVCFYQTNTWAGSANLAGKAMLSCADASARINVGPQCSAQIGGGLAWDTMDAASAGRIHGYLGFQNKLLSGKELTITPPVDVAGNRPVASAALQGQFFLTKGAAGFADHLDVCVKKEDDTYAWVAAGGLTDYRGTLAFVGCNLAAGATQSNVYAATGATLGRKVKVAPAVDLGGLMMTAEACAASQIRVTLYNPTAGAIVLAAGNWNWSAQS